MRAQQARELLESWVLAEARWIGEVSTRINADHERLLEVAEARARELGIRWTAKDAPEYLKSGTKYEDEDED